MQNFKGTALLVDTTELFPQIFHVTNKTARVPYVTKLSLRKGRIIAAVATLGVNLDENFISSIIAKTDYAELDNQPYLQSEEKPVNVSLHLNNWQQIFGKQIFILPYDSCSINAADTLPFINEFAVSADGNSLIVNNSLTNSFLLYSKKANNWIAPVLLSPSQEEDTMFISRNVMPYVYQYLKTNHVLVSMYLSAKYTGQNIYVLASLPQLDMVMKDSTASVAYSNMPVCILKNRNGKNLSLFQLNEQKLATDNYSYGHSEGAFFEDDSMFVFRMQKGWPVVGAESSPQNDSQNPFLPEFYNEALTLCFYNINNQSIIKTAPLDSIYKKYKLGYYANVPLIKKLGKSFYYADKLLGKIYRLSDNLENSIPLCDLFGMDTVLRQMPYKEDLVYLESYHSFFNREIIDFDISVKNTDCKALIFSDKHYYLYQKTKTKIEIIPFPDRLNGLKITGIQFGRNHKNNLIAYGLYQNNHKIVVYSFKI